jgi:hypothetical protein
MGRLRKKKLIKKTHVDFWQPQEEEDEEEEEEED